MLSINDFNKKAKLKIIIKHEPLYTDYGFTFFIYQLGTENYSILYNHPHETQDSEGKFLEKASRELFSSVEALDFITGKSWKKIGIIFFRK